MKITFINVGYGEAILVEYPDDSQPDGKFTMLIDGGSNEDIEFDNFPFRIRAVEYLLKAGIMHISLMVCTHIHEDHMCGLLKIAQIMPVESMWCNYRIPECFIGKKVNPLIAQSESERKFINSLNDYNELSGTLIDQGIEMRDVKGIYERVEISRGLYVDILGPEASDSEELKKRMESLYTAESEIQQEKIVGALDSWMNNASIMLRIHAGKTKILLPGDVNREGYGHLMKRADLLESNIFKIGHHGQIDGASPSLVEKINPLIIVTCASSDRRYESANPKLLELIGESTEIDDPVFLFSDIVELPQYSQGMKGHYAVIIDIDESNDRITWAYK